MASPACWRALCRQMCSLATTCAAHECKPPFTLHCGACSGLAKQPSLSTMSVCRSDVLCWQLCAVQHCQNMGCKSAAQHAVQCRDNVVKSTCTVLSSVKQILVSRFSSLWHRVIALPCVVSALQHMSSCPAVPRSDQGHGQATYGCPSRGPHYR